MVEMEMEMEMEMEIEVEVEVDLKPVVEVLAWHQRHRHRCHLWGLQ